MRVWGAVACCARQVFWDENAVSCDHIGNLVSVTISDVIGISIIFVFALRIVAMFKRGAVPGKQCDNNKKLYLCLRPSWNIVFACIIKLLRTVAHSIRRDVHLIRLLTDHALPKFLLPSSVRCYKSNDPSEPRGEWICPSYDSSSTSLTRRYILYFHGGAFCLCGPETHRDLISRLVQATGAHVFALKYKRPPEHPFPAALEDCVAAYEWLLRTADASQIVLAGDSAGGNLAVSTILACASRNLPRPAGALLLSPWVDIMDAGTSPSWVRNADVDYLPHDLTEQFARSYRGAAAPGELLSPALSDRLGSLPPLHVECGACEMLADQVAAFCARARAAGADVRCEMREDMVHNFVLFAVTGVPQCAAALRAAGAFVDRVAPRPAGPTASPAPSPPAGPAGPAAQGNEDGCRRRRPSGDAAGLVVRGGRESNRG